MRNTYIDPTEQRYCGYDPQGNILPSYDEVYDNYLANQPREPDAVDLLAQGLLPSPEAIGQNFGYKLLDGYSQGNNNFGYGTQNYYDPRVTEINVLQAGDPYVSNPYDGYKYQNAMMSGNSQAYGNFTPSNQSSQYSQYGFSQGSTNAILYQMQNSPRMLPITMPDGSVVIGVEGRPEMKFTRGANDFANSYDKAQYQNAANNNNMMIFNAIKSLHKEEKRELTESEKHLLKLRELEKEECKKLQEKFDKYYEDYGTSSEPEVEMMIDYGITPESTKEEKNYVIKLIRNNQYLDELFHMKSMMYERTVAEGAHNMRKLHQYNKPVPPKGGDYLSYLIFKQDLEIKENQVQMFMTLRAKKQESLRTKVNNYGGRPEINKYLYASQSPANSVRDVSEIQQRQYEDPPRRKLTPQEQAMLDDIDDERERQGLGNLKFKSPQHQADYYRSVSTTDVPTNDPQKMLDQSELRRSLMFQQQLEAINQNASQEVKDSMSVDSNGTLHVSMNQDVLNKLRSGIDFDLEDGIERLERTDETQ